MTHSEERGLRKRSLFVRAALLLVFVAPCCVGAQGDDGDRRLGDLGRVRFAGGGCEGSTTLVAGSTATLSLVPQGGERLPPDLSVGATVPEVVSAEGREGSPDQIVLRAGEPGESYVELRSAGDLYDGLIFRAEPATAVVFRAPEAVFLGSPYRLRVDEVHGSCGEDCPLIGEGFILWTVEGAGALTLSEDAGGLATFRAEREGALVLSGADPTTGRQLIAQEVTVVGREHLADLEATLLVATERGDRVELVERAAPLSARVGEEAVVRLVALTDVGVSVPIEPEDCLFTLDDPEGILEVRSQAPGQEQVLRPLRPGRATVRVEVPSLALVRSFELMISVD